MKYIKCPSCKKRIPPVLIRDNVCGSNLAYKTYLTCPKCGYVLRYVLRYDKYGKG